MKAGWEGVSYEKYIENFRTNNVLDKEFFNLNENDLSQIGIKSLGDRKKIMRIIKGRSAVASGTPPAEASNFYDLSEQISSNDRPRWLETDTAIRQCQQSVLREFDPHTQMIVRVSTKLKQQHERNARVRQSFDSDESSADEDGESAAIEIGSGVKGVGEGRWIVLEGDATRTGYNPKDKSSAGKKFVAVVKEETSIEDYAYPRLLFPADMFEIAHGDGIVRVQTTKRMQQPNSGISIVVKPYKCLQDPASL